MLAISPESAVDMPDPLCGRLVQEMARTLNQGREVATDPRVLALMKQIFNTTSGNHLSMEAMAFSDRSNPGSDWIWILVLVDRRGSIFGGIRVNQKNGRLICGRQVSEDGFRSSNYKNETLAKLFYENAEPLQQIAQTFKNQRRDRANGRDAGNGEEAQQAENTIASFFKELLKHSDVRDRNNGINYRLVTTHRSVTVVLDPFSIFRQNSAEHRTSTEFTFSLGSDKSWDTFSFRVALRERASSPFFASDR